MVSLDDVATRAGVSKSTIFVSKNDNEGSKSSSRIKLST